MGRDASKAMGNPWYEARKNASIYDDRLQSREGAAELLGMSVSAVSDAELNLTKCMPVDKAVLMADLYNAPELLNYYCLHECPIGCGKPISDSVESIENVAVRMANEMTKEKIQTFKHTFLEIAADGKITEDEKDTVRELISYLDRISVIVSQFKILAEKEGITSLIPTGKPVGLSNNPE